jgi:hypothetical protein
MVDVRHQHFVIARFADYCAFSRPYPPDVSDPVGSLLLKLAELEGPLNLLKQGILEGHLKHFFKEAVAGVTQERAADFRSVLEGYLTPGDFADASFHLMDPAALQDPGRLKLAMECISPMKAVRLIDELLGDPDLSEHQIATLQATIRDSGAVDTVETMIARSVREATAAIEDAPLSRAARSELVGLADLVTRRAH